jgi:hypothetical protein
MAVAERVVAVLLTFISCYYLSVLVMGRWWGVLGKLASGRRFTSLPVRVVASLYLMILACFSISAWVAVIFQPVPWASTVVGIGYLLLILTLLAEGLLPRWRSTNGAEVHHG